MINTINDLPKEARSQGRGQDRGALFRVLDCAARALEMPATLHETARVLIRFIPADAPVPVSPARVQDLARERGVDPRTIRNHVRRLIALGLAEDLCFDGGHRAVRRSAERIVVLAGIGFAPMLAQAPALAAEAARLRAEDAEHMALRAEITQARHRFRALAPLSTSGAAARAAALFEAMPRRYAHLPRHELAPLRDRLRRLLTLLASLDEAAPTLAPEPEISPVKSEKIRQPDAASRKDLSDQSEKNHRPNPTKEFKESVNADPGTIHALLPADWRAEYAATGQVSWTALTSVAHARALGLGIPNNVWTNALATLGCRDTTLLTLAAESEAIRSPAAWMRAMTLRARERGSLDLSRNLAARRAQTPRSAPGIHPQRDLF